MSCPTDSLAERTSERARRQSERIRSIQRGDHSWPSGGKEDDRREAGHHHPQNEDPVEVHDRTMGLRNASGFCRTGKSLLEPSLAISGRAIKSGRFLQGIFEDFSAHEGMKVRSGKHPIEYSGAKTGAFVSASDDRPCGASR